MKEEFITHGFQVERTWHIMSGQTGNTRVYQDTEGVKGDHVAKPFYGFHRKGRMNFGIG